MDNANDRIHVSVTGAGRLMGLDNGDSTDADGYQVTSRCLFGGKLLIMVGSVDQPGDILVNVTADGLPTAVITLTAAPCAVPEGVSCRSTLCGDQPHLPGKPVREIRLVPVTGTDLSPECPDAVFEAVCLPEDADPQDVSFRVTNDSGITSLCATIKAEDNRVTVTGLGDGTHYLRATVTNGYPHTRVISMQQFTVTGMGSPFIDPYELVIAGLYTFGDGITAGNEQGIAFGREGGSLCGFSRVNFGADGSDRITLPIFALDGSRYDIRLYLGDPRKGGELVATLPYEKPSIWNVYQAETYTLPRRITGVQELCFACDRKVHMHGFSFEKQSRFLCENRAGEADALYGDSFTRTGDAVTDIGNNVTLQWNDMDLGQSGRIRLHVTGATPLKQNVITLRIRDNAGEESTVLLPFDGGETHTQSFDLDVPVGRCELDFVFLPGSRFDFINFRGEHLN